jgi:hypothetical protein
VSAASKGGQAARAGIAMRDVFESGPIYLCGACLHGLAERLVGRRKRVIHVQVSVSESKTTNGARSRRRIC